MGRENLLAMLLSSHGKSDPNDSSVCEEAVARHMYKVEEGVMKTCHNMMSGKRWSEHGYIVITTKPAGFADDSEIASIATSVHVIMLLTKMEQPIPFRSGRGHSFRG